jgi:type 1 fimbria pilin
MLLAGWLSMSTAQASCLTTILNITLPTQNDKIPSDGLPAGKSIGDWSQDTINYFTNCTEPLYALNNFQYQPAAGITYTEGGTTYTVLQTGIDGIGFIGSMSDSFSNISYPLSTNPFYSTPYNGSPHGFSVDATFKFKLISTKTLTPGVYNIPRMSILGTNAINSSNSIAGQAFVNINAATVTLTANTCNLMSSNLNISLNNVSAQDLPTVGSTAKDKAFSITMDCQSGVYINAQLNGTKNTDVSTDGVLQVDNVGMNGTSRGIGIQILSGTTPMPVGTNIPVKFSAGGNESLQFVARYYRTQNEITTGAANATATLNITYQ